MEGDTMRTSRALPLILFAATGLAAGGCALDPGDTLPQEDIASQQAALETFTQTAVDNAHKQASNSANNLYAGNMTGMINTRYVSWKSTDWCSGQGGTLTGGCTSQPAQATTCTYGWCGFWPVGNCNLSSGDNSAGYSYGACNSTAWGERFAGFLWNASKKANYKTKTSGTTTFGYHPYWCFNYNGKVRTYHGWSYSNHCGTRKDFDVGTATPAPVATCGNSVKEGTEGCDLGTALNGKLGSCCTAQCTLMSSGSVCRASTGECDKAETCDGVAATCPSTNSYESSFVNLKSGAVCSTDSQCITDYGQGYVCMDLPKTSNPVTTHGKKCLRVCRDNVGACDSVEYCHVEKAQDGNFSYLSAPACAIDLVATTGTSCSSGGQSGTCSSLGVCDTAAVPTAWSCDNALWGDGKCNCGCGAYDADGNAAPSPVYQVCPGGQQCVKGTSTGGFACTNQNTQVWANQQNGDNTCVAGDLGDNYCDVGCGSFDADCDKIGVKLWEHCASGYSASWGEKTCHAGAYVYSNNGTYFGKCPASYGTDSSCDIGCQFVDAKCGGPF
jgi:hypothetical protein